MGAARIEIWDPLNTTKLADAWDVDGDLQQRNIDELAPTSARLNESGSGGFVVQRDHPAVPHIAPGNVVRLLDDSEPVYAYRVVEAEHTEIARLESDRVLKVDGEDLLEDGSHSTVDPWTSGRPVSLDRVWNFAAPRGFDDSAWSTVNHFQERIIEPRWPVAYPMPPLYAGLLWTRPHSWTQPVGSTLWRRPFELDDAADLAIYQAADDAANMWADGALLNRNSVVWPDMSGWQKTWREVPPFSAGEHVVAFEAFNYGGPAFLMSSAFTVTNGLLDQPIFSTGDLEWRWLDYPTEKPGFTAPQILQMLLDEAQARSELNGWTISVHEDHPNIEEFSVRVGTNYRAVIENLRALWCDVAADTESLVLHLWPKGEIGTVQSVVVPEAAITSLQRVDDDDICNSAQALWAEGSLRASRPAHPTLGRRSESFQMGAYTDRTAVLRALNLYLDAHAVPAPKIAADVEADLVDATAGVDYQVGDTIEVAGQQLMVVSITWRIDPVSGELRPVPGFESLANVRRAEVRQAIDRMAIEFETPAGASVLDPDTLIISGHPNTTEWQWSWAEDIEEALNEIDPQKPWQVKRSETAQRIHKFRVEIDPDDLPDAWGTTRLQLMKNSSVLNVLFDIELTTTVPAAEVLIWGYETILPSDRIRPRVTEVGGHVDGTITVGLADPV